MRMFDTFAFFLFDHQQVASYWTSHVRCVEITVPENTMVSLHVMGEYSLVMSKSYIIFDSMKGFLNVGHK